MHWSDPLQLCDQSFKETPYTLHPTPYTLHLDLGGHGENKAFGKQLLEQKVDRQSCQREAVNSLFVVSNSYSKQTNNCRLYLLIFLIRGLLRCSCRGGMQWGLPSWRAVCLHLVQMLPQLQQQVQLQFCKHWCWWIPDKVSLAKDLAWLILGKYHSCQGFRGLKVNIFI